MASNDDQNCRASAVDNGIFLWLSKYYLHCSQCCGEDCWVFNNYTHTRMYCSKNWFYEKSPNAAIWFGIADILLVVNSGAQCVSNSERSMTVFSTENKGVWQNK